MTEVEKARVEVGATLLEILSGGIQIIWQDGLVCLVFDASPDDGPGLPGLEKNRAHLSANQCFLDIKPIALPFPAR